MVGDHSLLYWTFESTNSLADGLNTNGSIGKYSCFRERSEYLAELVATRALPARGELDNVHELRIISSRLREILRLGTFKAPQLATRIDKIELSADFVRSRAERTFLHGRISETRCPLVPAASTGCQRPCELSRIPPRKRKALDGVLCGRPHVSETQAQLDETPLRLACEQARQHYRGTNDEANDTCALRCVYQSRSRPMANRDWHCP